MFFRRSIRWVFVKQFKNRLPVQSDLRQALLATAKVARVAFASVLGKLTFLVADLDWTATERRPLP